MQKRGLVVLLLFVFVILSSSLILAQENSGLKEGDELNCLSCGDGCYSLEKVATMYCGPSTKGEPICGVENGTCVVIGFDDESFEGEKVLESPIDDPEFNDEALEVDAGTTPDSAFYFIDEFFDQFGDEIKIREEKIAEIKAMVEAGDIESAREALNNYLEQAKELEKEVDPDKREEALRSAAAIRNALEGIQENIPEGERDEFVKDVIDREGRIATAAEIAHKIKELCLQLSDLDLLEYGRMCKSGEDSPNWQKKLDKDLTEEQIKEAKKFGKIMEQCFKTSGQNCRCEEIPYPDFANACAKAAPLATACDIGGDEDACDKLDSLEMPRLPDHLQDVFDELEDGVNAKYDNRMPPECVEAGATTRNECAKVMVTTHAPEECKDAMLEAAEQGEFDRRVFEKICDGIMMEIHAPDCAEKGINDPDECARYMDNFRDDRREGHGPRIDFNCKEIQDAEKRLECYDKASSQASSYGKGFNDEGYDGPCMTENDWRDKKAECRALYGEHAGDEPIRGDSGQGYECVIDAKCIDFGTYKSNYEWSPEKERECAQKCESQGRPWDFRGGECICKEKSSFEGGEKNYWEGCEDKECPRGYYCEYGECKQHEGYVDETPTCDGVECGEASHCESGRCVSNEYGEGEGPGEPSDYSGGDNGGEDSGGGEEPQTSPDGGGSSDGSGSDSSSGDSGSGGDSGSSDSSSGGDSGGSDSGGDSGSSGGGDGMTGGFITGNAFLDYWYR